MNGLVMTAAVLIDMLVLRCNKTVPAGGAFDQTG